MCRWSVACRWYAVASVVQKVHGTYFYEAMWCGGSGLLRQATEFVAVSWVGGRSAFLGERRWASAGGAAVAAAAVVLIVLLPAYFEDRVELPVDGVAPQPVMKGRKACVSARPELGAGGDNRRRRLD